MGEKERREELEKNRSGEIRIEKKNNVRQAIYTFTSDKLRIHSRKTLLSLGDKIQLLTNNIDNIILNQLEGY